MIGGTKAKSVLQTGVESSIYLRQLNHLMLGESWCDESYLRGDFFANSLVFTCEFETFFHLYVVFGPKYLL